MAYQRIVCRSSLCLENLSYSFTVSCVTAKTIDRLSRKTYSLAVFQMLCRIHDGLIVIRIY